MIAVRPMNLLLGIIFLILSGCQQHSDSINMVVLKGGAITSSPTLKESSSSPLNTRYQAIPIEQSSGNAMRDALEVLFAENELEQYYTSLHLSSSHKEAGDQIYIFQGKAKSKTALSQAGLAEVFIIRIGRNQGGLNFSIEFIES